MMPQETKLLSSIRELEARANELILAYYEARETIEREAPSFARAMQDFDRFLEKGPEGRWVSRKARYRNAPKWVRAEVAQSNKRAETNR